MSLNVKYEWKYGQVNQDDQFHPCSFIMNGIKIDNQRGSSDRKKLHTSEKESIIFWMVQFTRQKTNTNRKISTVTYALALKQRPYGRR